MRAIWAIWAAIAILFLWTLCLHHRLVNVEGTIDWWSYEEEVNVLAKR